MEDSKNTSLVTVKCTRCKAMKTIDKYKMCERCRIYGRDRNFWNAQGISYKEAKKEGLAEAIPKIKSRRLQNEPILPSSTSVPVLPLLSAEISNLLFNAISLCTMSCPTTDNPTCLTIELPHGVRVSITKFKQDIDTPSERDGSTTGECIHGESDQGHGEREQKQGCE